MIEIYYLSGTGNSLHVAKELRNRITDSQLIPLASLINEKKLKTKGDIIGFIFPVHFMTAPSIVFKVLKKMDLQSTNYIFAIATRYGTPCNEMYKQIEKILKVKNKHLNAHVTISMANNDPKFSLQKKPAQEELVEIAMQKKIELIHSHITKQADYHEIDSEVIFKVNPIMERLGVIAITLMGDGKEKFYSDSCCDGCGSCEKICPAAKIKMIEGKPEWEKTKECYSCYACINFCPNQSIQIKSPPFMNFHTAENNRYQHPEITFEEIANQKHS